MSIPDRYVSGLLRSKRLVRDATGNWHLLPEPWAPQRILATVMRAGERKAKILHYRCWKDFDVDRIVKAWVAFLSYQGSLEHAGFEDSAETRSSVERAAFAWIAFAFEFGSSDLWRVLEALPIDAGLLDGKLGGIFERDCLRAIDLRIGQGNQKSTGTVWGDVPDVKGEFKTLLDLRELWKAGFVDQVPKERVALFNRIYGYASLASWTGIRRLWILNASDLLSEYIGRLFRRHAKSRADEVPSSYLRRSDHFEKLELHDVLEPLEGLRIIFEYIQSRGNSHLCYQNHWIDVRLALKALNTFLAKQRCALRIARWRPKQAIRPVQEAARAFALLVMELGPAYRWSWPYLRWIDTALLRREFLKDAFERGFRKLILETADNTSSCDPAENYARESRETGEGITMEFHRFLEALEPRFCRWGRPSIQ